MKKRISLLLVVAGLCFTSIHAQETKPHPCDSLQPMFDQALVVLDSLLGNHNELKKQLDKTRLRISKLQTEVSSLLKEKNETMTVLNDARKLISGQMDKIKELEAEVKRLSAAKSGKKGT